MMPATMPAADRARRWRGQLTARGVCHGPSCLRPATGFLCGPCRRREASRVKGAMRLYRILVRVERLWA
jgi:hypothetical protein